MLPATAFPPLNVRQALHPSAPPQLNEWGHAACSPNPLPPLDTAPPSPVVHPQRLYQIQSHPSSLLLSADDADDTYDEDLALDERSFAPQCMRPAMFGAGRLYIQGTS